MTALSFFIPVVPKTKGNSQEIHTRKFGRMGTRRWIAPTDEQKAAEAAVRAESMRFRPECPLAGPLRLDVTVVIPIPKSYSKEKRRQAIECEIYPDTKDKGDRGNHLKLLEDALEGVFYGNDAQICRGEVAKIFGEVPGYSVSIEPLFPEAPQ